MELSFTATKLAGGVIIKGDPVTLRSVERLLTRTSIDSHCCWDDGMCMVLSRYFESNNKTVDWVTLISGITCLRSAIGYKLSRKDHAIICLLEYLMFDALCNLLNQDPEKIESALESLYGLNDRSINPSVEPQMVYLYLLKDPELRKSELLKIIESLSPVFGIVDKKYNENFKGLNRYMLNYSPDEKFQFEL